MTLRFVYTALATDFDTAMRQKYRPIARAATLAIQDATDLAKLGGRASIAAAGFSRKWQSALRSRTYPGRGKFSADAAGIVYSKIGYAEIFEEGGTITGKPLLWLPLPDAPRGRAGKKIPAGEYRQFVGHPLYSIRRPGKTPLLGAVIRQTSKRAQKGISLSQLKRGRNPHGRGKEQLVPLYFGIPKATIKKKFDVAGAVARARDELPRLYFQNLQDE